MTITESTRRQLFDQTNRSVIRMQQKRHAASTASSLSSLGTWTIEEHELFLEGLNLYPSGPWKRVAQHIGSRTPRQVMTHAQKYRQRLQRRAVSSVNETPRQASKKLQTDRVLSVVVSPMQMAMPAGSTGEIQVEAGICVLPVNGSAMFTELDELFAQLATDPMFDGIDMSLPYADVEPLQF
ncbi:hypothetical protein PRIC1_001262 [Phytophthora ramorum]|uniref:Uncharacterized protein n=1 Tax=Phytophthora ramorum TaxID=164328 RepID=H3GQ51_PHYRM|nr:Myb-like protein J [Phytophthora ramorum]